MVMWIDRNTGAIPTPGIIWANRDLPEAVNGHVGWISGAHPPQLARIFHTLKKIAEELPSKEIGNGKAGEVVKK